MLGRIAWSCFGFAYASVNLLAVICIAAVRDKAFSKTTSKEEIEEFENGIFFKELLYTVL